MNLLRDYLDLCVAFALLSFFRDLAVYSWIGFKLTIRSALNALR